MKKGETIDKNNNSIEWAIAISTDGNSFALKSNGKTGPKPGANTTHNNSNLNNYQGKGTSSEVRVYDISGILSSDKFVLENFKIYPNPTPDILHIKLENSLVLEKVLIYNTSSKLVKESTEKTINLSSLAKGIYNVQVLTNRGKATQKVVVK